MVEGATFRIVRRIRIGENNKISADIPFLSFITQLFDLTQLFLSAFSTVEDPLVEGNYRSPKVLLTTDLELPECLVEVITMRERLMYPRLLLAREAQSQILRQRPQHLLLPAPL